jgi:hypothetical protein
VAVQELAYAAEQSGADMATLETGVRKMQRAIVEAGQGAEAPAAALAKLGLSAAQLAGQSPDKQLAMIGARLTAIEDPGEKAAAAMELFGKSGTSLLPMLKDMDALQAEFRDKGLGMSAEDVAAAEAYGDALSTLTKSFQSVVVAVGGAVAPMLKSFAESVTANAVAVRDWIQENSALLGQVLKYGTLLLAGGAAMTTFGKAVAGVATAFKLARLAMIAFSTHPLIAILTAVAAGVLLIVHQFTTEAAGGGLDIAGPPKQTPEEKKRADQLWDEMVQTRAAYYRRNPHRQSRLDPNKSEVDRDVLALLNREKAEKDALYAEELAERGRVASLNERLQNELHHLKINGIEDEYTREWQSIQATYDEKVRAAEKAGADIELIEMARRERLAQLDRKHDQKAAEEEKRWQADVGRSAEQMQDEIDRLTIENNKELTAEEKAKQLMELRQAHEIRGLREAGVDTDENMRLLREKHALEAGQLLMAQNVPAAMRQTVAGTFNATMVGRMGGGNYAERTARATEKTAKNTEELLKKPAPALAFG